MEGCSDGLLLAASIDLPSMLVFYFFLPLMPASNCIYVTLDSASFFSKEYSSYICYPQNSAMGQSSTSRSRRHPPVLLPNHHDELSSLLDLLLLSRILQMNLPLLFHQTSHCRRSSQHNEYDYRSSWRCDDDESPQESHIYWNQPHKEAVFLRSSLFLSLVMPSVL